MSSLNLDVQRNQRIIVEPVSGYIGAELSGIELSKALSDDSYAQVRGALNEYGVIFFRDQKLTPDQFLAFGQRFGTVSASHSKELPTLPGYPLINSLITEPTAAKAIGESWHVDQSYREKPTFGTILYGKEVPVYGGDTSFINMAKAYETLSEGLKAALERLKAVHAHVHTQKDRKSPEAIAKRPGRAVHPVVTTHPENGRKVLYVNPGLTERFEGWTEEESTPLLNYLFQHALQPEFGCRFRWKNNSIAFWDNRQVWHAATGDYLGVRRVMQRLVVE